LNNGFYILHVNYSFITANF